MTQAVLSPRQREIAQLLDQGKTQAEVALELGISVRTVEAHLAKLRHKLGASTTRLAVSRARARAHRPRTG